MRRTDGENFMLETSAWFERKVGVPTIEVVGTAIAAIIVVSLWIDALAFEMRGMDWIVGK